MLTLFYASALTILGLVLAFLTGRQRFKTGTNLGVGDDIGMLQITRAHGNLIEYALFFLILSFLLETVANVPNIALMILGDIFLLSIMAHAYWMTRTDGNSVFRAVGIIGTILVLGIQSLWGFFLSFMWLLNNNWGF